jgi:hypothetical protein
MDAATTEGNAAKHERAIGTIETILDFTEMNAPTDAQGTFIATGNAFDALAAVGKVFSRANKSPMIVDPYADQVLVRDFVPTAPEMNSLSVVR